MEYLIRKRQGIFIKQQGDFYEHLEHLIFLKINLKKSKRIIIRIFVSDACMRRRLGDFYDILECFI